MSKIKRFIACCLIFVLTCTSIKLDVFSIFIKSAGNTSVTVEAKEKKTDKSKDSKVTVEKELEYLRTANSSTYLMSDGSRQLEIYGSDIRYEEDGKFIDYNPSLVRIGTSQKQKIEKVLGKNKISDVDIDSYAYVNAAGDSKNYFPDTLDSDIGVLLEKDNRIISFKPIIDDGIKKEIAKQETKEKSSAKENNKVTETINSETKKEVTKEEKTTSDDELSSETRNEETTTKTEIKTKEKEPDNEIKKDSTDVVSKKNEINQEEISLFDIKDNSVEKTNISYAQKNVEYEYRYTSRNNGVKEEIIINKKPQNTTFEFEVNLPGMELRTLEGLKDIQVIDKETKKSVAYIEEPNIKYNGSDFTYDSVHYEIVEQSGDCYILKVVVDKEYFESDSTKYPVVIDPGFGWYFSNLESATVSNSYVLSNLNLKNSTSMQVQNKCNTYPPHIGSEWYCYLDTKQRISNCIADEERIYIESCKISFTEYQTNGYATISGTQTFTPGTVEVRAIEGDWDPDTITWNNRPSMSNDVVGEFSCTGVPSTEHVVDITNWARSIYKKEINDYGLALKAKEENTGDTFYTNSIHLSINYYYTARYYGIPGVYAPSGNYSDTTDDLSFQSVLGDVSISRTYNSLQAGIDAAAGEGFDINYGMKVTGPVRYPNVVMPGGNQWRFMLQSVGPNYIAIDNKGKLVNQNNKYKLTTPDKMEYGFGTNNCLEYIKDEYGNQLDITTDSDGKILSISDDSDTNIQFTYYSDGHLQKVEEMVNNTAIETVSYTYTDNHLTKVSYPGGRELHYQYTNGKLTKETQSAANGADEEDILTFEYYTDNANNEKIKSVTNSIGVKSTYVYDTVNRETTITDSTLSESCTRHEKILYDVIYKITDRINLLYDEENQVVEQIDYEDGDDDPDCPSSITDEYGNVTNYEYDDNGNVTRTVYPDNSEETWTYDADTDNLTSHTDRNGLTTVYAYDPNDEELLLSTTCGGIQTESYTYYNNNEYDIEGLVKTETDAHGNKTTYTYDDKGNVLTSTLRIDGVDHVTTNTYDDQGNVISITDPNGIVTEYTYNESGDVLLTKEMESDGSNAKFTRTVHDSLGRVVQEIEPLDYNSTFDLLSTGVDAYLSSSVGTRTTYNDKGQVISETDRKGNTTSYTYDNDGNVVRETQPNGSYEVYEYDNEGRKTEEYFYDNGTQTTKHITSTIYTEGENKVSNVQYITDSVSNTTVEEYDWEGNVIKRINPSGLTVTYTYENGLLKKDQKRVYMWTKYTYDTWGRVTKEETCFDSTGKSEKLYTYDNYGNVIIEKEKNNAAGQPTSYKKTAYEYDSCDNQIKTVVYEGNDIKKCSQSYYSWDGKLLREYKKLSLPITISGLDNVQNTNNQDYSVTKYDYNAWGLLTKKTDPLGQEETYQYDKEDQQISRQDRKGTTHTTQYDKNGNVTKEISGNITKEYTYDNMDHMTLEKEGNTQTAYTYDGKGNVLSETTGNVVKTFSYNNADMETEHIITVNNQQMQKITNTYNNLGQLSAVYENDVLKASYTYDMYGQLTQTVNANGTKELNEYNNAGCVTNTKTLKGRTTISDYEYTYYYDGKERSKSDVTSLTSYLYDDEGKLVKDIKREWVNNNTSISNAIPVTVDTPTISVITESDQVRYYRFIPATTCNYTIESTDNTGDPELGLFSSNGTLIQGNDDGGIAANFKLTVTLTAGTEYIFGVADYMSQANCTFTIKQSTSNENTTRANAKMISVDNPEYVNISEDNEMRYFSFVPEVTGSYTIESYNSDDDPFGYLYTYGGSYLSYNHNSGTGNNFKITRQLTAGTAYVIGVMTVSETGNMWIRITSPASVNKAETEYTYDVEGNRTALKETKNQTVTNTAYTYDKNNRMLTKQVGNQSAVTYTYDANGNMTSSTDGITQTFDTRNRMTQYSSGNTTTTYSYYPNDMRKSKTVGNANTLTQVWNGDEIELELNGNQLVSNYVHGEKLICGTYGWYHYNAHGDVTALTDSTGTVTKTYDYNAFGVEDGGTPNDNNPYRYSGEYYDKESGYTYLQARYYDAENGRFVSEDPAEDGDNWYVYCGNNPINMIDPTGMWAKSIHREMTKKAYEEVGINQNKYSERYDFIDKEMLLNGSDNVDEVKKDVPGLSNGKYHGHSGYLNVMKNMLKLAIKKSKGKNKQSQQASYHLGMALHTIQDFYAHNIILNGKGIVNSREVATGKFILNKKKKLVAEKYPKRIGKNFISDFNSNENYFKGKIKNGSSVHHFTADNPNAYFNGKVWKWTTVENNYRYEDAIEESKKFLTNFLKQNKKLKKLKIRKQK